MTDLLREELTRLAEGAPAPHPLDVAPDAWRRGRRARRLDRAVVLAVLAAVLVVVGGTASLLVTAPARIAPAAPVDGPAAVPAELKAVPVHVQDDPAAYSADLAIGRQSLAFVTGGGTPVVVSATDGRYRLLDLEGWSGPEGQTLVLSPDGTGLAVGLTDGVRVVDLETGESQRYTFPPNWLGDLDWRVVAVAWSTDGREVYYGAATGDSPEIATGRVVEVETGDRTPPLLRGDVPVSAPAGTLMTVESGGISASQSETLGLQRLSFEDILAPVGTAYVSPDLERLAVGNADTGGTDLIISGEPDLDRQGSPAPGLPLGWVDDTTLAILDDSGIALRDTTDPTSADRPVVVLDDGSATELPTAVSVAVDLLDRPTADRPGPDWPWSEERQRLVLAGAGLLVLLAAATAVVVRRRPAR